MEIYGNLYIGSFFFVYMQKKVTLSLDSDVYKKFQEFCEDNDIMLSKRVEKLIIHHIEEETSVKKGGKK